MSLPESTVEQLRQEFLAKKIEYIRELESALEHAREKILDLQQAVETMRRRLGSLEADRK